MNEHLILILRSLITYVVLLTFTRLMGRKQIPQLTFFDYIVGITIGSIAGVAAIDKNVELSDGIISIILWSLLTIGVSKITLKNISLRLLIESEPLFIIKDGIVIYKNMKKARYNIGDLLMQLRDKEVFNITEVEAAILEPDGKLSVLKKPEFNYVTAQDMKLPLKKTGMMLDLILDGNILSSHLYQIKKDEHWLLGELQAKNIHNIKNVVYAGIQADEVIYTVLKNT